MKKLQCTKCGQVFWTELEVAENLIGSGEWVKNTCPKCGWDWAMAEPGIKPSRVSLRGKAKTIRKRQARAKEVVSEKGVGFTPGRIKSLRKKLGISQKALATLIDVTPWAIVSWEKGKFKPRKDRINKLAELAEKNKEEIMRLLSEKTSSPKENRNIKPKKSKRKGS